MDLEELDEDSSPSSPPTFASSEGNKSTLTIDSRLENDGHFKSFEMEDLDIDADRNQFDLTSEHPREGSFETEELEIQMQDLAKSHTGEQL